MAVTTMRQTSSTRQLELSDRDPLRRRPHRASCPMRARRSASQRPLLVTDPALAKLPMIANAVAACREAGLACEVFCDMQANPVEANVTRGVAAYRSGSHDGVIAFGGGSALDAGKAIALMVGQTRPIWDFEDREDWYTRVNVAGMAPTSPCRRPRARARKSAAPR